jgi:hypothetical protein
LIVEQEAVEHKRRRKIDSLKKLKRSLKDQHKGSPFGIRAILAVEKEIIKLEGLTLPTKIQVGGDPAVKTDLSKLSTEELQQIINLSKKAIKA